VTRDAEQWDRRYAAAERVWSARPNVFVVDLVEGLTPGSALDVGAGEGRNALWLAEQGWSVTAVDFSAVAIERGRSSPGGRRVDWQVADVTSYTPDRAFDLVLLAYLHLRPEAGRTVLRRSASWVAPGGHLVVVSHAVRNLLDGVGGPQDPEVLHDEDVLAAAAEGLVVQRLEEVQRPTPAGVAIDVVMRARRPE
jgi:2-polyprenyl-3-methyl-5-hydroxy-6-metoxy-1,4-benzoquinol methylase